jgi:hypothetical protein
MVIDSLDRGESEKDHTLSCRHSSNFICNASTEGIEQESFKGVVVESSVCVRNVESVMSGMESS